jgi:lysophospholipase L1-like esterase
MISFRSLKVMTAAVAIVSVRICLGAVADGSLSDTNIAYFGRWDRGNASVFHGYWGGAYLKVVFTGTTIKVNLGNTWKYHVKIDNKPWVTFVAINGTNNLTTTPLTQGTHTLVIAQGQDYDYDFAFKGLVLDPGAKTVVPSVRTDLIEWIGDSITDGYTDTRSDVSDYAWICAESLNCEHTQIAFPGIALVDGYGINSNKNGMCSQYFKMQDLNFGSSVSWDFSKYTAKVVVINIGTNDGSTPNDLYQSTYVTFLANIRAKFSNAHIFVLVPNGGSHRTQDSAAYQARVAAGDTKVHFINSTGWLQGVEMNDGAHPSDSGHAKLARLLKPLIAPYLTPATPVINPAIIARDSRRGATPAGITIRQPGAEMFRLNGSIASHSPRGRFGQSRLSTGIYLLWSREMNSAAKIQRFETTKGLR